MNPRFPNPLRRDLGNLLKATKLAQRGKRFKESTARFNFQLESELWDLQRQLLEKRYVPGKYRHFVISEPKRRIISAAPYRDRVVHHAVHNVLEPIFDPTFIDDTYATRKGRGTHAVIDRFQEFARRNRYILKCDVQRYFPTIDHKILLGRIRRKIVCSDTLLRRFLEQQREQCPAQTAGRESQQRQCR